MERKLNWMIIPRLIHPTTGGEKNK